MLEKIAQRKRRNKEVFGKKVSQYNMKGKRLAVFPTINDAAKATGINNAQISLAIKKIRSSAGGSSGRKDTVRCVLICRAMNMARR